MRIRGLFLLPPVVLFAMTAAGTHAPGSQATSVVLPTVIGPTAGHAVHAEQWFVAQQPATPLDDVVEPTVMDGEQALVSNIAQVPMTPEMDPGALDYVPPQLLDDGSDRLPDAEPLPAPQPEVQDSGPARPRVHLASIAQQTWVYAEPRWNSRRIGYLRAGAVVQREVKPAGFRSCAEGWYRIEPNGYVCVNSAATLSADHLVVEASSRRPARDGLPYTYVMSRLPTPPFYARLPSREEQLKAEPDLASHLRQASAVARRDDFVQWPAPDPVPWMLADGRPAPLLGYVKRSADALVVGRAKTRSGFALLSTFDYEGRRFGLTTDLTLLPIDRTRVVKPSSFAGLALTKEASLPVAFAQRRHGVRFVMDEQGGISRGEPLQWREAIALTGKSQRTGGVEYLEAVDHTLIRSDEVKRIMPPANLPVWASSGRKWIDVSILQQSLVAYEGTQPVYVTLVSTGADGTGDPKTTHSTIQGAFLIHTKHISVTMDGDEDKDEFDFRDVPFVQYFTEGYALHAAYWHDAFGTPRSHGCINLSPKDAAWLFGWTTPDVPGPWHGALSLRKGTLVYIHP